MTTHTNQRFAYFYKPTRPRFDIDEPTYSLTDEQAVGNWTFPEYSICLQITAVEDINILSSTYFNIFIKNSFVVFEVDGAEVEAVPIEYPLVLDIAYIESTFTVCANASKYEIYLPLDRNLGSVTLFEGSSLLTFQSLVYSYRKPFIHDCLAKLFDVDEYDVAFSPTSLSSSYSKGIGSTYTLIAKGDVEEGLLAGIWEPLGYQDWRVDREAGDIRLTLRQDPNLVESFAVEKVYELAVGRTGNELVLYVNGMELFSTTTQFQALTNSVIAGSSISTEFYDYEFITEEYYVASYTANSFQPASSTPVRSRSYSNYEYMNNRSDLEYSITGDVEVATNSLETYTVTLSGLTKLDKNYSVSLQPLYSFDTVLGINLSTDTLAINAGALSSSLSLTFTNISNPAYSRPFKLVVGDEHLDISITSYNPFNWVFSSWDYYTAGYLHNASIPTDVELDDTLLVSANSAYGEGRATATALFDSNVDNVRSIALLYNEQTPVAYRTYVENELSTYMFNGGADGAVIGSPDPGLSFSEFVRILELSIYTYAIALSFDESGFAVIDYVTGVLKIYETSSGKWDINNVTEIPLEHSTVSSNIKYSADSTCLLIGLPEADEGEGRALIYRRTLAGWERELIVGSPVPITTLGGFGYSLCSNASATILYVSELGSSTVYKFVKVGSLWSAEPDDAFIGTGRFGFHIACSNDASVLAVCDPDNATYVYKAGTLEHTETGDFNHVAMQDGYILLSSLISNATVELSPLYVEEQSIAYGNVALYDLDRNICILDAAKAVRVYKNFTSYIAYENAYAIGFSSNNLLVSNIDQSKVEVLTDNAAFLPNIVESVYMDGTLVPFSTVLEPNKPHLVVINTSVPVQVRSVGSLSGIFYGIALFDQSLSSQDVALLWLKLKQYYKLEEYSIYAT